MMYHLVVGPGPGSVCPRHVSAAEMYVGIACRLVICRKGNVAKRYHLGNVEHRHNLRSCCVTFAVLMFGVEKHF